MLRPHVLRQRHISTPREATKHQGSRRTSAPVAVIIVCLLAPLLIASSGSSQPFRQWRARYDGPFHSYETAVGVVISPDGNLAYVTGSARMTIDNTDWSTLAYDTSSGAQVWESHYDLETNDHPSALALSPDGERLFVTGMTFSQTTVENYATVAYDASTGTQLWASGFDGPLGAHDIAKELTISPDGATVFVTGESQRSDTLQGDYLTVAYDAATGVLLWSRLFDRFGNGAEGAVSIAAGPDGSTVFVTGHSGPYWYETDFVTVAYDASSGIERWVAVYDGPIDGQDDAKAMVADPNGARVFVTGSSSGNNFDFATVAYDPETGAQLWVTRFEGPGGGQDNPQDMAISADGTRLFVTGVQGVYSSPSPDFGTVAYNAVDGNELWRAAYDGLPGGEDIAWGVAVNPVRPHVYVTGHSLGGPLRHYDYAFIAYNADTGAPMRLRRYNGPGWGDDLPTSIAVSHDGTRIVFTGTSMGFPNTLTDYATIGITFG